MSEEQEVGETEMEMMAESVAKPNELSKQQAQAEKLEDRSQHHCGCIDLSFKSFNGRWNWSRRRYLGLGISLELWLIFNTGGGHCHIRI